MSWSNGTVRCDGCRVDMEDGKDWVSFGAFGADVDDRKHYHQTCWQTGWYTGIEPKGEWPVNDNFSRKVTVTRADLGLDEEPTFDHIKGDPWTTEEFEQLERDFGVKAEDPVNSPSHYRWLPNGIEVIDITETLNFTLGNAVKYILRADHKGKPIEDLRKAAWYIERELDRRRRDNGNNATVV